MLASLKELAAVFLKLGTFGFGGPAAYVAMIQRAVVQQHRWLDDEAFLDLLGASHLIPGPNATELAIHIGYRRAGWPGLIVAGLSFILPSAVITIGFAWAYVTYGALPLVEPVLVGIQPAVIAIIVTALARMSRSAVKNVTLGLVGMGVAMGSLAEVAGPIVLLFAGSMAAVVLLRLSRGGSRRGPGQTSRRLLLFSVGAWAALGAAGWNATWRMVARSGAALRDHATATVIGVTALTTAGATASGEGTPFTLGRLGLFFLKVGAILYGGGYVLTAYLQADLVDRYGWLSESQLLDSVAIGQFTPGPIMSTATFIGFLLGDSSGAGALAGAAIATAGIFLPSFVFVAAVNPVVDRLRRSAWTADLLDGVNVCSVGLMAAVTIKLAGQALDSWQTWLIGLLGFVAIPWFRLGTPWIVLGGALGGWLLGISR
jgi:chromate transporter